MNCSAAREVEGNKARPSPFWPRTLTQPLTLIKPKMGRGLDRKTEVRDCLQESKKPGFRQNILGAEFV
jgi:hypothetical protein